MVLTLTRAFPPIVQHPRCYVTLSEDEARQLPLKPLEHGKSLAPGHAGTIVLYTEGEVHGYVVDVKYEQGPPEVFLVPCSIAPTADEVDRFDGLLIEDAEAYSLLQRLQRPSRRLDIFQNHDSVDTPTYLKAHRFTLDPVAGHVVNTMPLTPAQVSSAYAEAAKIVGGLLPLPGAPPRRIGAHDTEMLHHAIALFSRLLVVTPKNCAAMWLCGKAYQLLNHPDCALEQFIHAADCDPAQNQYALDAAHLAIQRGRGAEALRFSEQAEHVAPHDAEVVANLAIALLINGDIKRAVAVSEDAVKLRPNQASVRRVSAICAAVAEGRFQVPHAEPEVRMIAEQLKV